MKKTSLWKDDASSTTYGPLTTDLEVDVAIIGGGITGLTTGYFLTNAGKKVAILEADQIGSGSTGFSTGNLYKILEEPLQKLEQKFNTETIHGIIASRKAAIRQIENIVNEFTINCDFQRRSWHLISETPGDDEKIEREYEACFKADLKSTIETTTPLPFKISKALRIENQAQFNPMQYVQGIAAHIVKKGCIICEQTQVTHIEEGTPNILHTEKARIKAHNIIHATHTPKGFMTVQTLLGPYREYAIGAKLNSGTYPEGIFWVLNGSNHYSIRSYTRTNGEKNLIIIGEPHKVGQKEHNSSCFEKLEQYLRSHFDIKSIDYHWSAQNYKPADGLPYIGNVSEKSNIYIATGFSTDGLTYGTLAGMIISDAILGNNNPWAKIYDPHRHTPIKSAGRFIKENANVLVQYVKDIPFKAEVKDASSIRPGEGKTVEMNGEKYAIYRDDNGDLHQVSAICTHLKCTVHFNDEERTWDCPCHGSRFTIDGKVIEGPALADLQKIPSGQK